MKPQKSLVLAGLIAGSAGCRAQAPASLLNFASPLPIAGLTAHDATLSSVTSAGGPALGLDFTAGAGPSLSFKPPSPLNWSAVPGLALGLNNPGQWPVILTLSLENASHDTCEAVTVAQPGTNAFTVNFGAHFHEVPGVQGVVPEKGPVLSVRCKGFDFSSVTALTLKVEAGSADTALQLTSLQPLAPGTAVPAPPPVTGLADQFGQMSWFDWPGKVHTDADLAAQQTAEAADLAANPVPAGRDQYGGWAAGPTLAHTGFFTTAKYEGKWAFVDPDGHIFLSMGMDCVVPSAPSTLSGREDLFTGVPDEGDPLALVAYSSKNSGKEPKAWMDYSKANLERKYGATWQTAWLDVAQQRLLSWGFNTVGNWSASVLYGHSRVPYVGTLNIQGAHPTLGSMADAFDPQFAADAATSVAPVAAKVKDDPWCLGYFVDNELSWNYGTDLAEYALEKDAAKSAAKANFLAKLKAEYVTIDALNTAWGTQFASWDAVAAPIKVPSPVTAALKADLVSWLKDYCVQYFTVIHDALHAADPNHLYLGCRFAHASSQAIDAAAQVCDVVSFNVYDGGVGGGWWNSLKDLPKPILVGEFHFGALDRGEFRQGMVHVPTQLARAAAFKSYVKSVINDSQFVGCHWFCYRDEPLLGRPSDGENYNIGFVTVTDTPYPELVAAAREVLKDPYGARWKTGG